MRKLFVKHGLVLPPFRPNQNASAHSFAQIMAPIRHALDLNFFTAP